MEFDNLNSELLSIVDTSIKYGKNLDDSIELEVFLYYENVADAEIAEGLVSAKAGTTSGNAVRAAKGKRLGFACSSGVSLERVQLSIKEATSIVNKISVENERFDGFCDPLTPGKEGILAEDILEPSIDELVEYCVELEKNASGIDDRIIMINSSASTSFGGYAVGNTRGVNAATRFTNSDCSIYVMSAVSDERKTCYEYVISGDRLFNIEGLAERAVKDCVIQHGSRKLGQTKTMPTIWAPKASASYILAGIAQGVLGQPVVEQVSPLCDRIGDMIASKDFTMIDDGQSPDSLGANAIDAEGHPQSKTRVVENGVLKGFLFDTYFGRSFGLESTGNCSRGSSVFGNSTPYESGPTASTKRLRVSPGKRSFDDIISNTEESTILIKEFPIGIFHGNVATGEFSAVANEAFLVENGEIKYPLDPVSVAGQFYEGLSNMREIGSDILNSMFGVDLPTLVFDGFSIVG